MIRFVDLKTGNIFDGTPQIESHPYRFWFDGEQSTNLIYSKQICVVSDEKILEVSIEDNEIFSLVDPSINIKNENIGGVEYHNIRDLIVDKVIQNGTFYRNFYVYMFYFIGKASHPGEYIVNFYINEERFELGADFYNEEESLCINLSNQGISIPESIQKAIYTSNIHEDYRDNILLNRKWKELLSNYWDMVTNKGSYKSLYNTLKWFEYGDLLRLCQLYKDSDKFGAYDISSVLTGKYVDFLDSLSKTTYLALYCSLEKDKYIGDKIQYDSEKNPVLEKVSFDWSIKDLSLKLCMLGNFYETYFMPIHLDLIHSTIENVVYSNTFKTKIFNTIGRNDFIYNINDFDCNVKDGSTFRLSPVKCYVGPKTLFGTKYEDSEQVVVGVQKEEVIEVMNDDELKSYYSQFYQDIGSIVDFKIDLPISDEDRVKKETILFKTFDKNNERIEQINTDYKILGKTIEFSILCPIEGEYEVRLQFDTILHKTFTKVIKFDVIDTKHFDIKIYKIQNDGKIEHDLDDLKKDITINNYVFNRQNDSKINKFSQYIPTTSISGSKGVKLNHMVITKWDGFVMDPDELLDKSKYFYFNIEKKDENDNKVLYRIYISRRFNYIPENPTTLKNHPLVYKIDYIFIPEFHKLVELGYEKGCKEEDIKYYTISDDDALCVIPELSFGKSIDNYEWEFKNASKLDEIIKLDNSISEPFIANNDEVILSPGYYDILFRYRLIEDPDKINEVTIQSAFIKK